MNSTLPAWSVLTTLGSSLFSKATEFFSLRPIGSCLTSLLNTAAGSPGGDLSAEMWCDVSPFFSCRRPAACIFPPHFHPSLICLRGRRGEKASWNSHTQWRLRITVFSKFLKGTVHTNTHTDHLMQICNHSALPVNHKSLLSCCSSRTLLLFDVVIKQQQNQKLCWNLNAFFTFSWTLVY